DAFTMKVGSDQSTTEINLETAHLYVSSGSTDSNFSRTNQFKLSQNFPSGEAIVPTSKTLSYTNSTEKVQNIPNAKINSTESGRSEEDGNIIIAAGMEKNIAIYKWANGNDVIYTLYPYNTSSFGVENGGIVPIYDSIELPLEKNGTLQYDRGYTIVRILYNGVEYEATGTLYDGAVDPIMFANTRIYANGRIVTNNLYANDGTFNGILNARGGTFNGTITATDGVMENVDVKNGMFSGDIVLRGGNTITVYDEDATIPSVTISSKDISIAPTEYSVSAGGGTISKTNSTWGKVSGTETIVLSTTNISAGSSVTIPSLKLSLDFKKKVESVSVSITYSTGGTDSSLLNVSRSDTKDHFESNSAEKTFNVSAECVLTIKMRVQYSLKSGFMGYSALYATVSPNAPMKILNNTGSGFNQVVIGKNGISYAANDATFFVKRDGTKTSIMMKVKNLSNKYNGIQIDDDEVAIMFGNKTYKLTSNTVPVSGGVALVWSQSNQ
ncbi:MAG: hypothetical protein J6X18_17075, partial [Bacteroidales bacterium]|nr:hypothetical protein [Bacteroidales bacterium]